MMRKIFSPLRVLCAILAVLALLPVANCVAGDMRIKLNDGSSLVVPYCWEENGQIKFEIPGGTVGIPKSQVASIEEVITSMPFSPDAMSQRAEVYLKVDEKDQKWLKDFMAEQTPKGNGYVTMNPEQVDQLLEQRNALKLAEQPKPVQVFSSTLNRTGEIAEWVRLTDGDVMLLLNNTVSTFEDLEEKPIYLSLFDGEGRRIKQVRCQIRPLKADRKKMKELGIEGRLYAVTATVAPDPRIKRYEITTTRY